MYKTAIFILLLLTSLLLHIIQITALKITSLSTTISSFPLISSSFIRTNKLPFFRTVNLQNQDDPNERITYERQDTNKELQSILSSIKNDKKTTLHICILVHGHKGQSIDLSYLKSALLSKSQEEKQSLLVHSSTCNQDKTDDGIINGGNRLGNEILQVLNDVCKEDDNLENINLLVVCIHNI